MIDVENIEEKTDEELVGLVLRDQDYFVFLMKRYEKKLFNFVKRISNYSKEEIEDILQEVFIKVYKNLNDFDRGLKFSCWIYRITRNTVINSHRKKQARPQISSWDTNEVFLNKLASECNIEREIDLKIDKEKINKTLNKLDNKYKEVLVLRFIEDKDYKEISDILQKPMGTVATLMNRAKKQFKENYNYGK